MDLRTLLLATALMVGPTVAFADLAISANDGKQVRAGDGLPMKPTPDSVSVIAFSSADKPVVIGDIKVCGTMIGPPVAVAVAPDYSFALSACPQTIDDANKLHPTDTVAVIGLDDPTHPKLLQTVHAGMGATGVFMNRKATIALVTGTVDDTITLFAIKDRQLAQKSQVKLEAKAEPRDVIVAPDGKTAWALRFGDGKVTKLKIDGDQLSRVTDYAVGKQPDGGIVTADGRWLINNNFGGVPGHTDKGATSVLDARSGEIVDVQEVGALPEHVVLSPDNKFLAVVVGNGSATVRNAPSYNSAFGKLVIFRLDRGKLIRVTDGQIGHACQGAVWSDDAKSLLVQCSVERDIEYFHFDGSALTRDDSATLKFDSRPGAIATSRSR